jgi:integrase
LVEPGDFSSTVWSGREASASIRAGWPTLSKSLVAGLSAKATERLPVVLTSKALVRSAVASKALAKDLRPRARRSGLGIRQSPTVNRLLRHVIEHADLRGPDGQSIRYTPHDFRRIFATEAVSG